MAKESFCFVSLARPQLSERSYDMAATQESPHSIELPPSGTFDVFDGTSGDDTFLGTDNADTFNMANGGKDTVLGKKSPDWSKVAELARRVAYTVNPEEWQKAGAPASGRGVTGFGTRWFLEAIMAEPKP